MELRRVGQTALWEAHKKARVILRVSHGGSFTRGLVRVDLTKSRAL